MGKLGESVKNHPYRYGAAGVAAALTAVEVIGFIKNPTYDVPEESCVSPWAVSQTYVNPNASPFLHAHQTGFGPNGVMASGKLPEGAHGVQASWKSPHAESRTFDENASDMVKADAAGALAVKMAIGDGKVQFGVRVVAVEGSPLCNAVPDLTYTYLDRSDYFDSPANLPWRNPVNMAVSVF